MIRLDHCVIHVSGWETANAFYRDVVGAEVVAGDDGPHSHTASATPSSTSTGLGSTSARWWRGSP